MSECVIILLGASECVIQFPSTLIQSASVCARACYGLCFGLCQGGIRDLLGASYSVGGASTCVSVHRSVSDSVKAVTGFRFHQSCLGVRQNASEVIRESQAASQYAVECFVCVRTRQRVSESVIVYGGVSGSAKGWGFKGGVFAGRGRGVVDALIHVAA